MSSIINRTRERFFDYSLVSVIRLLRFSFFFETKRFSFVLLIIQKFSSSFFFVFSIPFYIYTTLLLLLLSHFVVVVSDTKQNDGRVASGRKKTDEKEMRAIPRTSWSSTAGGDQTTACTETSATTNGMMTTTSKKKLKVLCLHSFRTSADIMKIQLAMGGWDKHVEDSTEFMCIDGIFPATGEPPEDVKLAFPNRGSFQWYDADRNTETGKMEYKGIVESAKFVDEIVKREGIDGLLGFSQGATLIGEMLKRSSESAGDDIEGSQEEAMRMKSLRFAVLISGMPSRADETLSEQMCSISERSSINNGRTVGASIPTLHVVGQQDRAIPPALTKLMCKDFGEKAVLLEHEKGHVIPKVLPPNEIGEKVKKFFDERFMEKNSNARL